MSKHKKIRWETVSCTTDKDRDTQDDVIIKARHGMTAEVALAVQTFVGSAFLCDAVKREGNFFRYTDVLPV